MMFTSAGMLGRKGVRGIPQGVRIGILIYTHRFMHHEQ